MSTTTVPHTTVTITNAKGDTVEVIAQHTETPGLFVTPELGGPKSVFTGNWMVTHGPSGNQIPIETGWRGVDLYTANRVANALSEVPVDWTEPAGDLAEKLKEPPVRDKVIAVVKSAKYPAPTTQWDEKGDKPVSGPAGYPNTAAQATAAQMLGHAVGSALQRYADNWALMGHDKGDEAATNLYRMNTQLLLSEYAVVHILRHFIAVDPDAADHIARDLWEAYAAGDGIGEWLAEWGQELGIPIPDAKPANVGVELPDPVGYEQVLATSLMYEEHGTIGSLRLTIAATAALGEQKFAELHAPLAAEARTGEPSPAWGDQERELFKLAHGASFYGWALVALLGWLAKEYPQLAVRAARMVDDIGTNGGNDYCTDISFDDDKVADEAHANATTD